jgi:Short C-terminal domain
LVPGEYAFSPATSNEVYLFAVDAPESAVPKTVSQAPPVVPAKADSSERREVQPIAASSIEERLKKLDDLYKKGLLTDAEYDKKRAAILSEI